jgi:hypothetical protein
LIIISLIVAPSVINFCISPFFDLNRWRPQWTRTLVQEEKEDFSQSDEDSSDDEGPRKTHRSLVWTISLVSLSVLAVIAETVKLLKFSGLHLPAIFLLVSWILVTLNLVFSRPRYCRPLLLAFYMPALVAELSTTESWTSYDSLKNSTSYSAAVFAIISIIIVLWMPFRPISPISGPISSVGTKPKNTERSPEDALRLWQFLTVSWIWPLIAVGKERQMEKEDVWLLAYSFQNGRLARAFRELSGSTVFRRLLKANGIDCCILVLTTIVELIASKCSTPSSPDFKPFVLIFFRVCFAASFASIASRHGKPAPP